LGTRASQVPRADASHIIIIYCCDDDDTRGSIKRDGEKRHRRSPLNTTRVYVMCIIIIYCVSATVPRCSKTHTKTLADVMYVYNDNNNDNDNNKRNTHFLRNQQKNGIILGPIFHLNQF